MERYLVIDLEVNPVERHGHKINPMYSPIVAIGLRTKDETCAKYIYPDELKEIDLTDIDVIVGHNFAFDLLFLWKYDWLQNYFKRGGRIFCTQYAHYTLTAQQEKYPALRDIAVRCYSLPKRPKYIEDLLFNKIEENDYKKVSDLPPELVLKDVSNDVEDTEKIYLQQVEKAKKLGMYNLLELEMDAVLATTEARYNGMKIDREVMQKNKEKLEIELKEQYQKLELLTRKYWL